jgi:outer membrane protease
VDHYKKSIAFFICFVSLFYAAGTTAAHGETRIFNRPYAFSLTPQAGFIYGTSYEIVYQASRSSEYLSELQWDLKPLFVLGLGVSLEPLKTSGFFTNFLIQAGLPGKTGTMEDRDWQTPVNPAEKLTNFSSHTNKLKAAFLLTLDAGYSFSVADWFFIRLFGSLDYFYFKMEGIDGYYDYSNWDEWTGPPTGTFSGAVIRYTQHWLLFSPGLSAGFMVKRFAITGSVKITPLIYCAGEDEHLSAKDRYNDYMYGKFAIEPALDASYTINPHWQAGLICSYRFITGARGETIVNNSYYSPNQPGAGLSLFETSLYVKFTL